MTDHQQRAAALVPISLRPLSLQAPLVKAIAAALGQAATDARADLATKIEVLVKGYDVGTLDAEMVVDRLRAVLAAAPPTEDSQR